MKVSEVAKLTGISVRTLHYYDEIGLLKPNSIGENNYRLYHEGNLQQLQQILFFRELGFSLKDIEAMICNSNFDQIEALEMHRKTLLDKRRRLDQLIKTVDQTIRAEKGEIQMTKEERFKGFNFERNEYEQEARKRWGDEAVNMSMGKIQQLKQTEKVDIEEQMTQRFHALAKICHHSPESDEAQETIAGWYKELNQIGSYSLEAFQGLGEMYVADERFTKNIDQFGEGLAEFMCEAMKVFAKRNER